MTDEQLETPKRLTTRAGQWWAKHSGDLVKKIIIAVVTFLLGTWWASYSGRLREFTYTLAGSSAIIKRPEISGRQITILIDDKPIDNISTVRMEVFNAADL